MDTESQFQSGGDHEVHGGNAGAVFLKDKDSKSSTLTLVRDQVGQAASKLACEFQKQQNQGFNVDQTMQDSGQPYFGGNEVSPSVDHSNAYPYDVEDSGTGFTPGLATRSPWDGFVDTVNFTAGDVRDWSLDQLYDFENTQGVQDDSGNRRAMEEYDKAGNNFAGLSSSRKLPL